MEIDLDNKAVLVTGGSSGIGEVISIYLAKSNARVALHYNKHKEKAEKLVEGFGNSSRCFGADLSNPMNAADLFNDVVDEMGSVDVLINNAGIYHESPMNLGSKRWLDDWNLTIAVNLTSAGMLCHAAIKHFRAGSGGRIINIASRAAFRGETEDYLAYAASKGGMISLSRSIARSFGKYNIKSFAIAPGWVLTGMTRDYLAKNMKDIIANELSLNEITTPDDIAPLVTLMASGKLDHATGCTIDMNAGSYIR